MISNNFQFNDVKVHAFSYPTSNTITIDNISSEKNAILSLEDANKLISEIREQGYDMLKFRVRTEGNLFDYQTLFSQNNLLEYISIDNSIDNLIQIDGYLFTNRTRFTRLKQCINVDCKKELVASVLSLTHDVIEKLGQPGHRAHVFSRINCSYCDFSYDAKIELVEGIINIAINLHD